jgi:hypothetical protein
MSFFRDQLSLRHLLVWLACLGLFLIGLIIFQAGKPVEAKGPDPISAQATFPTHPLNTPTDGATLATARPTFDWDDADGTVISYTLLMTGSSLFPGATITTTESIYTPTQTLPNDDYTWTVQAHNGPEVSGYVSPFSFTVDATWLAYLPLVFKPVPSDCPPSSTATFNLIPLDGGPVQDHPDDSHGDLNLLARGYNVTDQYKGLVDISGSTDPDAPQLAGLFSPNSFPGIVSVYQVNDWNWSCGDHGCPGSPLTNPEVTLIGLATAQGQPISIPERSAEIYGGGYKALVLYAAEKQITLKYTRGDSVVGGYSAHIENVCVDPNLIALYQAQVDSQGYHSTNYLPGLRNNEILGTALAGKVRVAIRDGAGSFLDPRSRKDWWRGY